MFKINIFAFLISMSIGFFIIYITNPKPEIVIKYPNVQNNGLSEMYIDNNKVCYKYKSIKI